MTTNQLAIIIDEDVPDSFPCYEETVTLHPITVSKYKNYGEHLLKEFSLSGDPSVKCKPKLNSRIDNFQIRFEPEVTMTRQFEISLYYIGKSYKLIHVATLNMQIVKKSGKNTIEFKIPSMEGSCDAFINDCIIFCSKILRKDTSNICENSSLPLSSSQFSSDCSLLFENETLANFKIIVEDKEFKVHKEILAAKSPVFLLMFSSEMKESKENQMIIEDFDSEVIQEMLRYIYTNTVNDLSKYVDMLFAVANKYDISKLKSMCIVELTRSLKIDNAIQTLEFANVYNVSALKEKTLAFMKTEIKSIVETEDYKALCKSNQTHLLNEIIIALM